MFKEIEKLVNKNVLVYTTDNRIIVGVLKGVDSVLNLILNESHERINQEGIEIVEVPLGLQILRGDNVYVIFNYLSLTILFLAL